VYYALFKRAGKQFRRSLKTNDREYAKRQLNELREEVASLKTQDARELSFKTVADRWKDASAHTIKESTAKRRKRCIEAVSPFFAGCHPTKHHPRPLRAMGERTRLHYCRANFCP